MNSTHTMKRLITGLFVVTLALMIFSCKDDNSLEKLRAKELKLLDEYMAKHHPDATPKSSGLYYFEVKEGRGDSLIRQGDQVEIFYSLWKLDSTLVYETNGYSEGQRYEPSDLTVLPPNQLPDPRDLISPTQIRGLNEALTYMKVGGVADLVINSQLALGQNSAFGVPGFTTLLMQVEVHKVYPAAAQQ